MSDEELHKLLESDLSWSEIVNKYDEAEGRRDK